MRSSTLVLGWGNLCALIALGACHETVDNSGELAIQASAKSLRYSDIAKVSATITGPDIVRPVVVPLWVNGGDWQGKVMGIPAGTDRVISALAKDIAGVVLFSGEATGVTILGGDTTAVSIVLFEMSPAPSFGNNAPIIDALTVSAILTAPGGSVNVGAQAHDPDESDVLTYDWSASCGSFASSESANTVWTAPAVAGTCGVTLTVTDDRGASVNSTVTLVVDGTLHGGTAVDVVPDRSPVINSIGMTPTPLTVGKLVTVNLDAVEPDGHVLTYQWSSDCSGVFTDATAQNADFTLAEMPASGTCRFQVDVADSLGAHTIGVLNQATGMPNIDQAPVIELASQSQDEIDPNQSVVLSVKASDPDGQTISFTWTASDGTLTEIASTPDSTSLRFTAPAVLPAGPIHVEVIVTDSGGQSTKALFSFSHVNHLPTITGTTIPVSPLLVDAPAQVGVSATDDDGDTLVYAWTSTCDGSFTDAESANPTFTLRTFPSAYYCYFEVLVKDGHGGQATTTLAAVVDHLPVVGVPTFSPAEIILGEPIQLTATATDPDGDLLSYSWSRSCQGAFDDRKAQNPVFTLSATPTSGRCSFTVTVTDARGGQAMAIVEGPVGSAPDITAMQATPLPLLAGQAAQLSVTVSDADGDPLTFEWASDCIGSLVNGTSATPTFTLTTVPASHLCVFQVLVSDGRGGLSLGQISGQAGPVVVNIAPTIDAYSGGEGQVSPGDVFVLSVSASDPEGQPVSYAWSATDGTLSGAVTQPDTSMSYVTWTAPSVLPVRTMHVTVVVSDPSGLQNSVTYDFTSGT